MALAKIKMMLQESIGLHSRSIGDVSIERAIRCRMSINNVQDDAQYLKILRQNTDEFSELIEEVVVPETWFFRNTSPFDALVEYLPGLSSRKGRRSSPPLKILSLPCSTGEEPYSIAMVLMERGLKKSDFSIDAFDISQRALIKAERAVYGNNSFREEYRDLHSKYFKETTVGFHLNDEVKDCVEFSRGNIVTDSFDRYLNKYDVIFCRNLLIYFDRKTQSLVIGKLHKLLKVGGIFCVGHAESSQVPKDHFQSLNIKMAFAFKKIECTEKWSDSSYKSDQISPLEKKESTLVSLDDIYQDLAGVIEKDRLISNKIAKKFSKNTSSPRATVEGNPAPLSKTTAKTTAKTAIEDSKGDLGASDYLNGLEKISEFIEQGKLLDAIEFSDKYLEQYPESSEGHYYQGLISHLQGSFIAAESQLKKAIYLNPHHHAAIGLLVLLADERGDTERADAYRRRQQRAINQRPKDDESE